MGSSCFLDSSALVKLYVEEAGTEFMLRLAEQAAGTLFVSALASAEIASALYRLERGGQLPRAAADSLLAAFRSDLHTRYVMQPVSDAVLGAAVELIQRHPLRAYDAMQLAACATVARQQTPIELRFVCSDVRLLRAAADEGFEYVNPEDDATS
ncbi:MAG: type II toxin-antitoxin system VapC family toxin [Terriglobales bacterium]